MESFYNIPDGCSKHNKCSSCPFPDCQAPMKDLIKRTTLERRHNQILEMASKKIPPEVIHKRTGLDIRSVYRIIQNGY